MGTQRARAARSRFPRLAIEFLESRCLLNGSLPATDLVLVPPPTLRTILRQDLPPTVSVNDPLVSIAVAGAETSATVGNDAPVGESGDNQTPANGTLGISGAVDQTAGMDLSSGNDLTGVNSGLRTGTNDDSNGQTGTVSGTEQTSGISSVQGLLVVDATGQLAVTKADFTGSDHHKPPPGVQVAPVQGVSIIPIQPVLTNPPSGGSGDNGGSGSGDTGSGGTGGTGDGSGTPPTDHHQDQPPADSGSGNITKGPSPATPPGASDKPQPPVDNAGNGSGPDNGNSDLQPPDNAASSPAAKSQNTDAPGISQTLAHLEAVKYAGRIGTEEEFRAAHAEAARLTDPNGAADSAGEKKAEGSKGSFVVGESAPAREHFVPPIAQTETVSPDSGDSAEERAAIPVPIPATPAAQGIALLASVASLDVQSLEQGVVGFFSRLDQFGQQAATVQERAGLPSWLVVLASAGVALEVARRRLKPSREEVGFAGADHNQTWTWFVDAANPLAPEPR